jgi:hypothetical protein
MKGCQEARKMVRLMVSLGIGSDDKILLILQKKKFMWKHCWPDGQFLLHTGKEE